MDLNPRPLAYNASALAVLSYTGVMEPTRELEARCPPYEGGASPSMLYRQYSSFVAPPLERANGVSLFHDERQRK